MNDKLQHFGVCFLIALIAGVITAWMGGSLPLTFASGMMTATAAGVGKEYGDSKAVGNMWDNMDLKADLIGGMLGAVVAVVISKLLEI